MDDNNINVKLSDITDRSIYDLFQNYISLLRNCPTYSLQTQAQSHNTEFFPISGGMIAHANNYFDVIKKILERRLTNAIVNTSSGAITTEKVFLEQLRDRLISNYNGNVPNSNVAPKANPANMLNFLQEGIDYANRRLNSSQTNPRPA